MPPGPTAPAPGFYPNLDADAYHASPGVSVSRLKRFSLAPAKALTPGPRTPALAVGSLLHCAILEPDELARRYAPTRLDRAGTKAWEAAEAAHPDKVLVKAPDWDEAMRIRDAVLRHPVAAELLAPGLAVEQSFYWRDPELGILRRGRADAVRHDMRILVDLKSAESAAPADFGKAAATYRYAWQDPYYRDGIEATLGWRPEAFVFIAFEKEAPYLTAAYELLPIDLEAGAREVRRLLTAYAACERAGHWPGYSDHLEFLDLPAWSRRRHDASTSP